MNKDLKAFLMKLVWSLACLPFALLSCTDNSDTAGAATGVVGFNTAGVDPALARTAIVDIASLKNTGFRVNAYYTGTEAWSTAAATATPGFMYNQFVEWKANAWTYSPTKYWPGLTDGVTYGKISFFAWNEVAGAVVSANTATGAPALTFTVANNNADQKDLVADVRTDEDVSGGSVGISFSHVLSRIGFTARLKDTYPGVTVTITSLKVKYKADAVESTGIYTFGDDDHADGTWTYPATKTYMSNTGDEVMTANVVLDSDPAKVKRVNGESNYLMLLPQTIAYGAISIEVTWDVDGISQKKTINLPDQVWQPEKCYDYVLVISAEQTALDPIVVNPWDDSSAYKPAKLIYHANGGTGNDVEQFVMTNIACPVIENSFAHPLLYSLKEWNTKADGTGTSFQPGDLFTCFTNTDLYAQWWGVIDLADPTKLPVGVTFASDLFSIDDAGTYGVIHSTTDKRIAVADNTAAFTVTLSNASIDLNSAGNSAFTLGENTNVTMRLSGTNTLKMVTAGQAGVGVAQTAKLVIEDAMDDGMGTPGSLTASGVRGAGIGGAGDSSTGGTITINSGTVNASSELGSGIGGSITGKNGTVIINDGTVTATVVPATNAKGAGIGGCGEGGVGTIVINGGTVTAKGSAINGSNGGGAGIGSAASSTQKGSGSITINGGKVYATGGGNTKSGEEYFSGASIGGGYQVGGCDVTITGGYMEIGSLYGAPCIGGGMNGFDKYTGGLGNVNITGGFVYLAPGANAPAIGMGWSRDSGRNDAGNVAITGGTVVATGYIGGYYAWGIGAAATVNFDSQAMVFASNASGTVTGDSYRISTFSLGSKTITLTGGITVNSGGILTIPEGWTLKLNGKSITNNGTIVCGTNTAGVGGAVTITPGYGSIIN